MCLESFLFVIPKNSLVFFMLLSGNELRGIMIVNDFDRPCVGASERVMWLAGEMDRSDIESV